MRGGGIINFAMARREKTLERIKPKRAAALQWGVTISCKVYEFSIGIKPWGWMRAYLNRAWRQSGIVQCCCGLPRQYAWTTSQVLNFLQFGFVRKGEWGEQTWNGIIIPDGIRFARCFNPLRGEEKFMAFRRSILFTRSQRLEKVSLEAPSSSNQAEIYFGLRFEMDGGLMRSHGWLEGKKQSKAQSFGIGREIVDCRVQKKRSSDRIGSAHPMKRFRENLRIGIKPNYGVSRRDYSVKRCFRTFFHKVSSILSKSL